MTGNTSADTPAITTHLDVVNALPHPVFTVSADNTFGFANSSAETFFQTSAKILTSRTLDWFIPPDSPITALVEQVRKILSPVSEYRVDVSSPRLSEKRWVDVYVSPVPENPGDVTVMFQVRSMAEALDRQLTHRGAARTVTGLAEMLGHEIKNPLSGIRGAAQLLETSGTPDDQVLTRLIMDEADRIVRLVDRMEVFSDGRPIERDPVNIHSVLEHVKRLARSGFADETDFVERYDPSLPMVYGNRDQLVQIVLNLVKNACEAMQSTRGASGGEPAKLTLTTAFKPGMRIAAPGSRKRVSLPISICVEDNGPGVPDELRAHMFDPFVSSKQNGSGLGLALVAKMVGDHGGVISCESEAGATRFEILLPRWSEDAPPDASAQTAPDLDTAAAQSDDQTRNSNG
ncbi:MAG: ATP-binding protein [Pseudomonadota bacterium]